MEFGFEMLILKNLNMADDHRPENRKKSPYLRNGSTDLHEIW